MQRDPQRRSRPGTGTPDRNGALDAERKKISWPPDPALYSALVRDHHLSHGAFRLWHLLRDYANGRGEAWPSQDTIAANMTCRFHSLAGWTEELKSAGYLRTSLRGQNHHLVYHFLGSS